MLVCFRYRTRTVLVTHYSEHELTREKCYARIARKWESALNRKIRNAYRNYVDPKSALPWPRAFAVGWIKLVRHLTPLDNDGHC